MTVYDILEQKRHGKANTFEEIKYLVDGFVAGNIPDYMMSAYLMAVCTCGMTNEEIYALTTVMRDSGRVLQFDSVVVDKHSTGGVSDSTSLILVPILAHFGIDILKMSGRSLGFTGGTIDKVEVFKGYKADISVEKIFELLTKNHGVIVSQSKDIAPADKLIYALRDKTATVDSIPLIASSIMSKKLATGAKIILLDVKYGSGAFMKTKTDALELAKVMVDIGKHFGKVMCAVVTNMDSPLGSGIGCAYEVEDILDAIKGKRSDLLSLAVNFACEIINMYNELSGKQPEDNLEKRIYRAIDSGLILAKFKQIISASHGSLKVLKGIPKGKFSVDIVADKSGYITSIDAYKLAKVVQTMTESSKHKAIEGVKLFVNIGNNVTSGEKLCTIYSNSEISSETVGLVENAITIGGIKIEKSLIYKVVK